MKYTDQMGQIVELESPAQRIVSLVPSQTEFLYHLGLTDEVVGITKFCIHPNEWWKDKTRVGGTKNAKSSRIAELKPDLIIGNKEENSEENIRELAGIAPIWMSDIKTLADAYQMMLEIGKLTGRELKAQEIVASIQNRFEALKPIAKPKNALYFIWKEPWMLAGEETFISELMKLCGLNNLAKDSRYPIFSPEDYSSCDVIMLSSEPYPFKQEDVESIQHHYPEAKVILVDGEMFSWYGSRLREAPAYFQKLLTSIE